MEQPKHDVSGIAGLDGSPVGVYVGGQLFKMGQLSQADYVDCAAWLAGKSIDTIMASSPTDNRPVVAEIKAAAISRLFDAPVDPIKMLIDVRCIERLAYLAAKRGGDYPIGGQWELFAMKLDKRGYFELQSAVWKVSGFAVEKKPDSEAANATPNP
ncbi:MAG: hypothetical protein Q7R41_11945 [Phycisphaerales bacterium]|nr:hypothetical protein [Phycisphaerales bacterium]